MKEDKKETLAACISEMAGEVSFKIGMLAPLTGGKLCNKLGSNQIKDHQDTKV